MNTLQSSKIKIVKVILKGTVCCWRCEATMFKGTEAIKLSTEVVRDYACMACWNHLVHEINKN